MDPDALRAWFDERAATHLFSGVALVWQGGQPLFSHAAGMAHRGHGVPVTEQSRFGVASITKMVTATTALRLVDRGMVRLDDRLIDVLPEDHQPAALTREHTLHHLLSHTSGLRNYHQDEDQTWASFTSCWDRIPMYRIRRPADMLPLFADLPAHAPPGVEFRYGDANFILAGLVIEAVTGRPWSDVATEEVLVPAGMVDSAFNELDQEPARLATGYLMSDDPPETWRANYYSVTVAGMPDGGLITTAPDLARLVDALLDGRLLEPASAQAMIRPQGPPSEKLDQYGYGCELNVENGDVTIIGHGGADPGVSTMVLHWLAPAITTVTLCNYDKGAWAATLRLAAEFGLADPTTKPLTTPLPE